MDVGAAPDTASDGGAVEWQRATNGESGNTALLFAAVVLICAYYFYNYARRDERKDGIAGRGGRSKDEAMARARELQQERLQGKVASSKAAPGAEKRSTPFAVKSSTSGGIASEADALRRQREAAEAKRKLLEIKKKKRQAYLRRKKEEEEKEEKRRKDRELGPGWQYRESGGRGGGVGLNAMDPGADSSSGGYKATKRCVKRGGG
uniref:Selenoprotein S n=1 Tax=Odontella aurita TaxID=265563 RepID=A0A7S4KC36_9STRA|mmetsp:Transcript_8772/g.26245  ORF Transcript_8772/g.26245 Transcript_8772/m.26245 type:complete len:206 (+) Transcript_8772:136-753(+)